MFSHIKLSRSIIIFMEKINYIGLAEAISLLAKRHIKISPQLFRHYCNTKRGPEGMIEVANRRFYTKEGINKWQPKPLKPGPQT